MDTDETRNLPRADLVDGINEVEELLSDEYGLDLNDVDQDLVEDCVAAGENPQSIVDRIAEKRDLTRIDGFFINKGPLF